MNFIGHYKNFDPQIDQTLNHGFNLAFVNFVPLGLLVPEAVEIAVCLSIKNCGRSNQPSILNINGMLWDYTNP
jgi:hypothetical protein